MSFASFLDQCGVVNPRLTKTGRADRRIKEMVKLEDEWFNLAVKGECAKPPKEETCPVCYENLGVARVTTACGHKFCVPCFTQTARETDNCPMCRESLSETKPNKQGPMDIQVSHEMLAGLVREACPTMVVGLYDTIYHDIVEMDKEIESLAPDNQSQTRASSSTISKKREDIRDQKTKKIMQMMSSRYMIFGYNVLHRANMWHAQESAYPFDPINLIDSIELRRIDEVI